MTSPLATSSDVRRRVAAWCLLPLAGLLLAACGDDDPGPIPTSGERETTTTTEATTTTAAPGTTEVAADPAEGAPTGEWTIESLTVGEEATEAPDGATLTFADGMVSVATGCNNGSGPAEARDGSIVLGTLGITMMACEDDVMAWEAKLVPVLEGELTYQLAGDELVLARGDSQLTLAQPQAG